jgi:hypothetical protein
LDGEHVEESVFCGWIFKKRCKIITCSRKFGKGEVGDENELEECGTDGQIISPRKLDPLFMK